MKTKLKKLLQEALENVEKISVHNKSVLFRQSSGTDQVKCGVLLEESRYTYSLRKWIAPRIMSKYSNRRMFTFEYFYKKVGEKCEVIWRKNDDIDLNDNLKMIDIVDLNQMAHANLYSFDDMLAFLNVNDGWIVNSLINIDLALITYTLGNYDIYENLLSTAMHDVHPKSPLYPECQYLLRCYANSEHRLIEAYINDCREVSESAFNKF